MGIVKGWSLASLYKCVLMKILIIANMFRYMSLDTPVRWGSKKIRHSFAKHKEIFYSFLSKTQIASDRFLKYETCLEETSSKNQRLLLN